MSSASFFPTAPRWPGKIDFKYHIKHLASIPAAIIISPFIKSRTRYPEGVSCVVRVQDEEDWIALSLQSALPLADEFVVVDSGSTDRTLEIVNELKKSFPVPLKIISVKDTLYHEQCNISLANASFRWIVKWDGDFIGHDDLGELKEFLLSIKGTDYQIMLNLLQLDGDLGHCVENEVNHIEPYCHTHHPRAFYRQIGKSEQLRLPAGYCRYFINKPYIFHLRSLKPARKIFLRRYWTRWRGDPDFQKYRTLEDYVMSKIGQEWGANSIEDATRNFMRKIIPTLNKYDEIKYRSYPHTLENARIESRYRIIYKDGKPFSRNDVE